MVNCGKYSQYQILQDDSDADACGAVLCYAVRTGGAEDGGAGCVEARIAHGCGSRHSRPSPTPFVHAKPPGNCAAPGFEALTGTHARDSHSPFHIYLTSASACDVANFRIAGSIGRKRLASLLVWPGWVVALAASSMMEANLAACGTRVRHKGQPSATR